MQVYNDDKLNILHFQHDIYDLGNGYFEVLEKEDFYTGLQQYLKRLFELGHKNIIVNILEKIGTCAVEHDNHILKSKALGILTDFTRLLRAQKDRDLFQIVVTILTGWLSREKKYHASYDIIFIKLKALITKMFSLQLWHQSEPLITVSHDITCGSVPTGILFKKQVNKLHRDIADQKTIQSLIQSFFDSKEPSPTVTCDVLKALAPYSSEALINNLFKCNRKEKRLILLDMIREEREGVLPILVERLKDKQPWYVVRNSMILLGNLGDSDLYSFARPFLFHPDSRVQREVVYCILALGGENVSGRLIGAFSIINDDVKAQLIELLGALEDPKIELLFIDILEQRMSFAAAVREDLVNKICSSGQLRVSDKVVRVLKDIVKEGDYMCGGFEPTLEVARKLLRRFEENDDHV